MTVVLRLVRVLALVMLVLVLLGFFSRFLPLAGQLAEISDSALLDDVKANRVNSVVFQGDMLYATLKDQQQFKMHKAETGDSALIDALQKAGVAIEHVPPRRPIPVLAWLVLLLAPLLVAVFARPSARSAGS